MVKTLLNVLKIALIIFLVSGALIVVFELLEVIDTAMIVSVLQVIADVSLDIQLFIDGYPNFWLLVSYFIFKDIILLVIRNFKKKGSKK